MFYTTYIEYLPEFTGRRIKQQLYNIVVIVYINSQNF